MKTKNELVSVYYACSHTRCIGVTISLVSKVGSPFIQFCDRAVCLAHSIGTKSLCDKIAVAQTAQDILSANIAGLPASRYQCVSLIAGGFEKDNFNQTR